MSLIAASVLGVFFGMGGCLVFVAFVIVTLRLPLSMIWLLLSLNGAWVLVLLTLLVLGLLLSIGMLMILP